MTSYIVGDALDIGIGDIKALPPHGTTPGATSATRPTIYSSRDPFLTRLRVRLAGVLFLLRRATRQA